MERGSVAAMVDAITDESAYLPEQPGDALRIPRKKKYVDRRGADKKSMLYASNGLAYFVHDNLDELSRRFGPADISGPTRMKSIGLDGVTDQLYLDPGFVAFIRKQFERFVERLDPKIASDDDLMRGGRVLDGALNRMQDRPNHPDPIEVVRGRCVCLDPLDVEPAPKRAKTAGK